MISVTFVSTAFFAVLHFSLQLDQGAKSQFGLANCNAEPLISSVVVRVTYGLITLYKSSLFLFSILHCASQDASA